MGAAAGVSGLLLPTAASAGRASVLVIGGSAMFGSLGRILAEDLGHAGYLAVREAKVSSGLARPDFFDWPACARALYAAHRPVATVCMFGGNDGQGLYMGKDADPPWIRWHEPGWSQEYGDRVQALLDAVTPRNEHVFWLGMPMMASQDRTVRMHRLNQIVGDRVRQLPRGSFLDTWQLLANAKGRYARTIRVEGKRVTVRAKDGVHFTRGGSTLIANHVIPIVRATMGV
ncbi:MAG: DUF459 domain-containing protein [Nannocystaceae bacterium]